jgi:hypothetical protein
MVIGHHRRELHRAVGKLDPGLELSRTISPAWS